MGDTTKIVIVDDDRPSVAVLENGLKDFPDVRVGGHGPYVRGGAAGHPETPAPAAVPRHRTAGRGERAGLPVRAGALGRLGNAHDFLHLLRQIPLAGSAPARLRLPAEACQ